jgi:predicted transcriptional regulator
MKKLSVANQVLNLLNTRGGFNTKQIIAETGAKAPNVYNALNTLRRKKMIAREEDGVYISQTQTSVSDVTNKPKVVKVRGRKFTFSKRDNTPNKSVYTTNLEKENKQLTEWTQMWKRKYDVLERDYTQAKVMYLNSQAVVAYLEEKVAQLIKG